MGATSEDIQETILQGIQEQRVDISAPEPKLKIERGTIKMEEEKDVKKVIDKKQLLKNVALIGIPFAIGVVTPLTSIGILGSIVATVVLAKKGKLKLQKVPKGGKITKVQTEESKIIEQYNEVLEARIRGILNKPLLHNQDSYELQIAQLRYQNQMQMLEKRIEFKLNESKPKGGKAFNKLQILALQHQHRKIRQKLQVLYENKGELNENSPKKGKLENLHRGIATTKRKLDEIDNKVQQAQLPFLEAIKERREKLAQTKDEKEIKRLEEEIKLLNSQMPQIDQILKPTEIIESSNLRIQINLLNKQKQELIDRMVLNSSNIADKQFREAQEIEHSRTR